MIYYFIALIGCGITRGIHEGMIHVKSYESMSANIFKEGVRSHRWHGRYYHKIAILRDLLCIVLGWQFMATDMPFSVFAGSLVLLWELCEVFESVARTGKPIMQHRLKPYENINFADYSIKLYGWQVWVAHGLRITTCIILITGGIT